jgi:hypothetical protein
VYRGDLGIPFPSPGAEPSMDILAFLGEGGEGFRPYGIRPLARSTCPFVRGWVTVAQST